MDLEKVREHIDHIDREIIKLLNERMELGLRAKSLKKRFMMEKESQEY
jgi:chorismate mutase